MTPEDEALARRVAAGAPLADAGEVLVAALLAALDAERAAHEETRRDYEARLADISAASGPGDSDYIEDRIAALRRERDEAQAALVALREAARIVLLYEGAADCDLRTIDHQPIAEGTGPHAHLRAALAALPATLAGQVRARVLREAAERLDHDAAEACAARRAPEPYRLATTGEMFQPTPSCAGYYERGLRCPDCPSEASGADTLRALADEAER